MQQTPAAPTKSNIVLPFLIVLLCAVLEPKLITDIMQRLDLPRNNLSINLIYIIIGAWILVIWLLISLIPHLFSLLYVSEGEFKDLLFRVGYGFLPMLVGIAISFYLVDKLEVSEKPGSGSLESNSSIRLIALISKISMCLSLPWVAWCLHKNNKLGLLKSMICVCLPFCVMYLLSNLIAELI